jgi:hypothetical protein
MNAINNVIEEQVLERRSIVDGVLEPSTMMQIITKFIVLCPVC